MSEKDRIKEIERRVAEAKYMSKPEAQNSMVVRDANGRWIFEVYLQGHSASGPALKSC